MCIIASKAAGIEMPKQQYIQNMFNNNSDGAGFMYAVDGKVFIEKGFMKLTGFMDRLEELDQRYGLKNLPLVMHFRITTHGGTRPENCHPFPVTSSMGMLKKLKCTTDLAIAHNGIIDIKPREKDISDTMEYVLSQLSPLKKAVPNFQKNKHLVEMIYNAIGSKMVIMNGKGDMTYIGDFREEDGVKYSNGTFKYGFSCYNIPYVICGEEDFYNGYSDDGTYDGWYVMEKNLMWIDDMAGDYIVDEEGEMWQGDFAIDKQGAVYEYSYDEGFFIRMYGARAFNANNREIVWDEESKWISKELVAF